MKVIVLGSGIIGITSAYFLAKAGCEVVVIDQESASAHCASYANAGQLSFSHIEPWTSFSSLLSLGRAIFSNNSFLSLNGIMNADFINWLAKFIKNITPKRNQIIAARLFKMGIYSKRILNYFLQEEKIDFSYQANGILHIYRRHNSFKRAIKQAEWQKSLGSKIKILSAASCVKLEPALSKALDDGKLVGGIFYADDMSGDCFAFASALERICREELKVDFKYNVKIENIFTNYKTITGINSSEGVLVADNYLSCLGSYGNSLLKGIGINLNIYPIKGYSFSIPAEGRFLAPTLAITDVENKVFYSRLGNVFRAGGTVEICGFNKNVNEKNRNFLYNNLLDSFSYFGDLDNAKLWSGFRPYRPDSLPIICCAKEFGNLFINSGHGSMGWTLSFASSRIITDIILEKKINNNFSFLDEMEKSIYKTKR